MANIAKIQLPSGDLYDIKDTNASSATNWLNGSADGSVRTKNSAVEDSTYTIGVGAVAEGYNSKAIGSSSHAEGSLTVAQGVGSHTEGLETTATMKYAHAEGGHTTASGTSSHAEGSYSTASGYYSHAEGVSTVANHKAQHAFGEYNVSDPSAEAASARGTYVEIVGNGTADDARSNARTLDWDGNEVLAGKLTLGEGPTDNMDAVTKEYADSFVPIRVGSLLSNSDISNTASNVTLSHTTKANVTANAYTTSLEVAEDGVTLKNTGLAVFRVSRPGSVYTWGSFDVYPTSQTASGASIAYESSRTVLRKLGSAGFDVRCDNIYANNIPTKTSDLTNDSGYITLADLPIYDGTVV